MRLETLPLILGGLAVLLGLVLAADAFIPDGAIIPEERRRSPRAPRSRPGQALFGAGMVAIGAALVGGDVWRYTTVAVLLAVLLAAAGVALNWRYLGAMIGAQVSAGQRVRGDDRAIAREPSVEPEVAARSAPGAAREGAVRDPGPEAPAPQR